MGMSYSKNPHLPRVRAEAVKMLRAGSSSRQVARHFGYSQSAIIKWNQRVDPGFRQYKVIKTKSSRPRHHPAELSPEIVRAILALRQETGRGADYLHHLLTAKQGFQVSLSSVKRTLKRNNLTKYSKWKKWHSYPPRPLPAAPGLLVQIDTVHRIYAGQRLYIYTLLDVYSRWAYAAGVAKIGAAPSTSFIRTASRQASFRFQTVQSDHGSEFSKWFTSKLAERGVAHRHSRVRTPNDNAHLERFNRTIQEECIVGLPGKVAVWNRELPQYLHHYNHTRPHMGLGWKTPAEMLANQPQNEA